MTNKTKNIAVVCLTAFFLVGFSLWNVIKPDSVQSVSERRPLAEFPTASTESVLSGDFMTLFEEYSLDQFPLRDRFRTLKAITAFYVLGQKDNNGIYIADGYASKLEYPIDSDSLKYAARRFQYVYDKFLSDGKSNIYFSLIPDKNCYLAEKNGYPSMDYNAFAAHIKSQINYAEYIDISGLLEISDFYSTDAHWRQEKITDVAKHIAGVMDVKLEAEYETLRVDTPFYGVYYGQAALPIKADELYYLNSSYLDSCKVFDYETQTYIPVYDLSLVQGNDPYEMFLSGSKSLLTIENPTAAGNRELIIFRDSFGSSLAPLLTEGYSKITLVDIRYILPDVIERFISFTGQDVLFLYSTSVLNNSETLK